VLNVALEVIGPASRRGVCYHATEPLDNPDFEKFCDDFHDILGIYPQTTTAIPLQDVKRTRALLKHSAAKGTRVNRFSVLSPQMLREVHATFSAEELLNVELLVQTKDSSLAKAAAGRLREEMKQNPTIGERERAKIRSVVADKLGPTESSLDENTLNQPVSISCITGFLFNMVEQTVALTSPCPADDRWPLGYMVFDEGTFTDADDLRGLLEQMISTNMPLALDEDDAVRFRPDLTYKSLSNGFEVATPYQKITITHKKLGSYIKNMGDMIQKGESTLGQIGLVLFYQERVPAEATVGMVNALLKSGILDEGPR
jgi:radical SAM family RiPP maturation amino acid epimerase